MWAGYLSRYSDWLRAGRSGDRIPVEARFSAPVQTSPGAHPAFCTMGTGSFPRVKSGRGMLLTTHPLLVPRLWKSRAIPLPTLWATTGPVTRTHHTFCLNYSMCLFLYGYEWKKQWYMEDMRVLMYKENVLFMLQVWRVPKLWQPIPNLRCHRTPSHGRVSHMDVRGL